MIPNMHQKIKLFTIFNLYSKPVLSKDAFTQNLFFHRTKYQCSIFCFGNFDRELKCRKAS